MRTGRDAHWRTERYGTGHPFLTRAAAEHVVAAGAALVGIDSLNVDDDSDGSRPAHTLLLGAGIPIVEHLCDLGELTDTGFRFFAMPVKVKGIGSSRCGLLRPLAPDSIRTAWRQPIAASPRRRAGRA